MRLRGGLGGWRADGNIRAVIYLLTSFAQFGLAAEEGCEVSEIRSFKNFSLLCSRLPYLRVLHPGILYQVKMDTLQNKSSAGSCQ